MNSGIYSFRLLAIIIYGWENVGTSTSPPPLYNIYYFIDLRRDLLSSLGCMAERLKKKILETDKMVDLVAGPGILYHTNGVYLS